MCIGLDSYSRGRSDGCITIAEQREGLSLSSVQKGCPWPAVDYSGIACIWAAFTKRSDSAGSNLTTAVFQL